MGGPRILLAGGGTGGHLMPALNLAEALRRAEPRAEVLLLGAERGIERAVLPSRGLPYRLLPMQPIYRSRPWRNWRLLGSAPAVVAGLAAVFRELDPELVVGTGGYASGPAVVWGRVGGRRTALQEQNARPGLVTRWLARHVDQLHLGYPEARARLRPGRHTRLFAFGNPVAPPAGGGSGAERFPWPEGRIVALIGGSQGARALNERLLADLAATRTWPEDVRLVWVTGAAHEQEVAARVGEHPWANRIRVVPFIPELGSQLGRLTLAVSRAGAMFLSELAAAGVPAVLVPLPSAAAGHQSENARALEAAGAAVRLEQEELRPGRLWETIVGLLADPARLACMASAMRGRGRPDAAMRIARELLRLAGESRAGRGAKPADVPGVPPPSPGPERPPGGEGEADENGGRG
ncbi:MAG: glycosyltransferase [Gemmatimonadota bacterium]